MPKTTATVARSIFWISALSLAVLGAAWKIQDTNPRRTPGPCVAVTLDDGPSPTYTDLFLKLLAHYKIRATFFFNGTAIEHFPAIAARVVAAGHEIGNHTWSHTALRWKTPRFATEEILRTDRAIRAVGYGDTIPFRAPFGQILGGHLLALWKMGRRNILYDVEPRPADYFRENPSAIARSALERVQPGSILLLHDGQGIRSESLEAAAIIFPALKKRGFCFATVGELFSPPHQRAHPP